MLTNMLFARLSAPSCKATDEAFSMLNLFSCEGILPLGKPLFKVSDDIDYQVYCCDDTVMLSGIPAHLPGAILGVDANYCPVIVVNDIMLAEDTWFMDAMIAHEVGHHVMHTHNRPRINNNLQIFSKEEEFQADLYAALTTNMYEALLHLKELGMNVDERLVRLGRAN